MNEVKIRLKSILVWNSNNNHFKIINVQLFLYFTYQNMTMIGNSLE